MVILGIILPVLGLVLVLAAGIVLLLYIFVSEEELTRFAELPLEASTSHMTGVGSGRTLSATVTDVAQLNEYRMQFIEARRVERRRGRRALWLLIVGSALQIAGAVVSFVSSQT